MDFIFEHRLLSFALAACAIFALQILVCVFVDRVTNHSCRFAEDIVAGLPGELGFVARRRQHARKELIGAVKALTHTCASFRNGWFIEAMNGRLSDDEFRNEDVRRDWPAFSAAISACLADLSKAIEETAFAAPNDELRAYREWAECSADVICKGDARVSRRLGFF